jgi:hypothetical protein
MGKKIIVFGQMPGNDAALISSAAGRMDMELSSVSNGLGFDWLLGIGERPAAVISYLPYAYELLSHIFGNKTLGFSEDVPFFQCLTEDVVQPYLYEFPLGGVFVSPLSEPAAMSVLLAIGRNISVNAKLIELEKRSSADREQKDRLVRIGTAICGENDFLTLLKLIMSMSREVTCADAGCIYTRGRMVDNALCGNLHFRLSDSDSCDDLSLDDPVVKIGPETMAGCAAYTGQFLVVDNVEKIRPDMPFKADRGFGNGTKYVCKSVLTMPLKNIEDEVVAVLQLMNKKADRGIKLDNPERVKEHAHPFTSEDIGIIRFLARYAAVALERTSLYRGDEVI